MPKEAIKREQKTIPKTNPKPVPKPTDPAIIAQRKKNIRLTIGFLVTLVGCIWTLSIISYCFNWRHDQNKLISGLSLWEFLFEDKSPVRNWGGRLGAAMSHLLVFRGVGVTAIVFTAWIIAKGVNILYGTRYINTSKWIRWMALAFLFISPLLSFTMGTHAFPYGGALGNGIVEWTEGFAGKLGTVFVLITVFLIFAFIVFNFDIKPWMAKARLLAKRTVTEPERETDTIIDEERAEDSTDKIPFTTSTVYPDDEDIPVRDDLSGENRLLAEDAHPHKIHLEENTSDLGMKLIDIQEQATASYHTSEPELTIPDHMIIAPVSTVVETVTIPTAPALEMEMPVEEEEDEEKE